MPHKMNVDQSQGEIVDTYSVDWGDDDAVSEHRDTAVLLHHPFSRNMHYLSIVSRAKHQLADKHKEHRLCSSNQLQVR